MYRIFEVLIVLFSISAIASGQPAGFNAVKSESDFSSKMKEYASRLTSIKSDFVQEKHLQYLDAALESGGKFWYQAPNRVRWEYTKPYKYILVLNNGKLKMISESSKTELDMKGNAIFEQVNNIMIASVSGNIVNNKDYGIQLFENNQYFLILMKPTSPAIQNLISMMELYIDKGSYAVTKIKMTESGSDYSIISFSNLIINENFDESLFTP
jgi:outer membrane lipoprotein-sorting protein